MAQRINSGLYFYGGQSDDYDRFRERLLTNRSSIESLPVSNGDRLLDIGGGTGEHIILR